MLWQVSKGLVLTFLVLVITGRVYSISNVPYYKKLVKRSVLTLYLVLAVLYVIVICGLCAEAGRFHTFEDYEDSPWHDVRKWVVDVSIFVVFVLYSAGLAFIWRGLRKGGGVLGAGAGAGMSRLLMVVLLCALTLLARLVLNVIYTAEDSYYDGTNAQTATESARHPPIQHLKRYTSSYFVYLLILEALPTLSIVGLLSDLLRCTSLGKKAEKGHRAATDDFLDEEMASF